MTITVTNAKASFEFFNKVSTNLSSGGVKTDEWALSFSGNSNVLYFVVSERSIPLFSGLFLIIKVKEKKCI